MFYKLSFGQLIEPPENRRFVRVNHATLPKPTAVDVNGRFAAELRSVSKPKVCSRCLLSEAEQARGCACKPVGFVRGFVRTVTLTKPTGLLQIFDLQAELRSVSNVKIGG